MVPKRQDGTLPPHDVEGDLVENTHAIVRVLGSQHVLKLAVALEESFLRRGLWLVALDLYSVFTLARLR